MTYIRGDTKILYMRSTRLNESRASPPAFLLLENLVLLIAYYKKIPIQLKKL